MAEDTLVDRWKRKAMDHPVIAVFVLIAAAIASLTGLVVGINGAWTIIRGEDVGVVLEHSVGQGGRIEPFMMTGTVLSRWDAVISNTGDASVSLLGVTVVAERSRKALEYSGLYRNMIGRVLDEQGKEVGFPVDVDGGHSTRLSLELKVLLDSTAFAFLHAAFPDGEVSSLQDANKRLANALGIDLFGQKAEAMGGGGDAWGVAVSSDERQPRITVTFRTARDGFVSATSRWYSGGKMLERGEDPFSVGAVRSEER